MPRSHLNDKMRPLRRPRQLLRVHEPFSDASVDDREITIMV